MPPSSVLLWPWPNERAVPQQSSCVQLGSSCALVLAPPLVSPSPSALSAPAKSADAPPPTSSASSAQTSLRKHRVYFARVYPEPQSHHPAVPLLASPASVPSAGSSPSRRDSP